MIGTAAEIDAVTFCVRESMNAGTWGWYNPKSKIKNAKFSTTVAKPLTPFENPVTGYTLLQIRLDDCPEKEQYIEVQLGE